MSVFAISCLSDDGYFNRHEMVSHCGFNLYLSSHYWCWASFPISVVLSCIWNVFSGLVRSPHQMYGLQIFFPFCRFSLHFVDDVLGQEATVRTGHGTTDWFQIGKICQGCILSPCLFNLYADYIMRNFGLDEAQAGIKIAGRNINHFRYADEITLWQKVKNN